MRWQRRTLKQVEKCGPHLLVSAVATRQDCPSPELVGQIVRIEEGRSGSGPNSQ